MVILRMSTHGIHLLQHLRRATAAEHRRIERHPLVTPLSSGRIDVTVYARVLVAFLDFFLGLERRLRPELAGLSRPSMGPYPFLSRASLLQADLRDLDVGGAWSPCPGGSNRNLPAADCADRVLGILYVLEGATQGGRVIAPRLREVLGLDETCGARYFHLYRQRCWATYRDLVMARGERHDFAGVAAAGRETFVALEGYLDAWWGVAPFPAQAVPAGRVGTNGG